MTGRLKDGKLYIESTTCIPYREGIESILDQDRTYNAIELICGATPIFISDGIYHKEEQYKFNCEITYTYKNNPIDYTVKTRIVEEPDLPLDENEISKVRVLLQGC